MLYECRGLTEVQRLPRRPMDVLSKGTAAAWATNRLTAGLYNYFEVGALFAARPHPALARGYDHRKE